MTTATFRPTEYHDTARLESAAVESPCETEAGEAVAYVRVPTNATKAATIASASLVLNPAAASGASAGTGLTIASIDFAGERLDPAAASADVLASEDYADTAAWAVGTPKTYDVASLVSAGVAVRGDVWLRITQTGPSVRRAVLGVPDSWLDAPRIEAVYDDDAPDADPLSTLLAAVWALLERDAEFCRLVPPGNRKKHAADDRTPRKDSVAAADLPQVVVRPSAGSAKVGATSSSSEFIARLSVDITTGDRRYDALLFPVAFRVYAAMRHAQTALTYLRWRGRAYVLDLQHGAASMGLDLSLLNAGITGWATIWEIEARLDFPTHDL